MPLQALGLQIQLQALGLRMPLQARPRVRNRASRLKNLKNLMQSVQQSMPQATKDACRSLCVLRDCAVYCVP